MDKASAWYHYRNEKLGVSSLTCHQREDMSWTIKHFGLDQCKKAYYTKLEDAKDKTETSFKFDQTEMECLNALSIGL
jgi:hypothetical protein